MTRSSHRNLVLVSKALLRWKEDLTSQQYDSILESFEYQFSYSNRYYRFGKEMYADLFEILTHTEAEISDRRECVVSVRGIPQVGFNDV